jgi:DNA-binding GntR family transcriptional regulator
MSAFKRPATISETIYQYLREAITNGKLKPGQRVQEKQFAGLFNVSSTPVREAFLKLAAEKYLVIDTHKEVRVRATTPEEVRELYEIVRVLDALALRNIIQTISDQDVAELKKMTERLGELYRENNTDDYLTLNLKIHDRIWRGCQNKSLYKTLVQLMEKISIYRRNAGFHAFANPAAFEKSYTDHCHIMDGLEKRDLPKLEKLISVHWGEEFGAETQKAHR